MKNKYAQVSSLGVVSCLRRALGRDITSRMVHTRALGQEGRNILPCFERHPLPLPEHCNHPVRHLPPPNTKLNWIDYCRIFLWRIECTVNLVVFRSSYCLFLEDRQNSLSLLFEMLIPEIFWMTSLGFSHASFLRILLVWEAFETLSFAAPSCAPLRCLSFPLWRKLLWLRPHCRHKENRRVSASMYLLLVACHVKVRNTETLSVSSH